MRTLRSVLFVLGLILISGPSTAKEDWEALLEDVAANVVTDYVSNYNPKELEDALRAPIPPDLAKQSVDVDSQLVASSTVSHDSAYEVRVRKIVVALLPHLHSKPKEFTIRILESEEVNAFTTGGPFIYFLTALMKSVESDDELAGIVAHELAHVDAAHCGRGNTLVGIGEWAGELLGPTGTGGKIGKFSAGAGATFNRGHESEADTLACIYLARAGYDPRRFIDFFERSIRENEAQKVRAREEVARYKKEIEAARAKTAALRPKLKTAWDPKTGCRAAKLEIDTRKARMESARLAYEQNPSAANAQAANTAVALFNLYVPLYNDCLAFNDSVNKERTAVARHNAWLDYLKRLSARPSPWSASHPFNEKRKVRISEMADYLQNKIGKDAIADPITRRVIDTVEKVEGKPVR